MKWPDALFSLTEPIQARIFGTFSTISADLLETAKQSSHAKKSDIVQVLF